MHNGRGQQLQRSSLGTLIPAIVLTSLRFFTRSQLLHGLKVDDYCLMVAVLCSIGDTIAMSYEIGTGLGDPIETLSLNEIETFFKCLYISFVLYHCSMLLTKVSILLGYLNIFPNPRVRIATKLTLGYTICCAIYWLGFTVLLCRPIAAFWNHSLKETCIGAQGTYDLVAINVSLNILSDLIIIGIPMPVILKLRLARKAKFWLVIVFSLGSCVTAITISRLPVVLHSLISTDPTYDTLSTAILSTFENNVGIICASLPPLRAFVQHYFPSLMPSLEPSSDNTLPHHRLHASDWSGGTVTTVTSTKDPEIRIESCTSSGIPLEETNKKEG